MPSRRAYLAALAGLAGCTGASEPPASSSTTTETTTTTTATPTTTTATTTTTRQPSVSLTGDVAQSSMLYLTTPDSLGVVAPDGRQFVFADVTVSGGSPPEPGDFRLAVGDETHAGWVDYDGTRGTQLFLNPRRHPYDDGVAGWVGFDLPDPVAAEGGRLLVRQGDEQVAFGELSSETMATLTAPPADFSLVEVASPERVAPDEAVEVSVTVENVGAGDGVFRGSLNETGYMYGPHPFRLPVAAGDRETWTYAIDSHVGADGVEQVGFRLQSAAGRVERTVAVERS